MSLESRIVTNDFKALNKFIKSLQTNKVVKIGIFGNKAARGDQQTGVPKTNPELGAIHEFGSFTANIPARSFLRMPLVKKAGDILKQVGKIPKKELSEKGKLAILTRLGIACENVIQKAFATRGFGFWLPNTPGTVRRKGSDAPLIDTGQLRRAITSKVGDAS